MADLLSPDPAGAPGDPGDTVTEMKKPIRKLTVRRETLRALANLELTRAAGAGFAPGTGPVDSCAPDECTRGDA